MSDPAKKEGKPAAAKDPKAGGPPRKKVTVKPLLRPRLRCDQDHDGVPWLARLYVIFRPIDPTPAPAPKADGGDKPPPAPPPPPPPLFQLAMTDADGYLSPLAGDTDAHAQTAGLLVEGGHYEVYLVRHPGADLPKQILADANKEITDAASKPAGGKSPPPAKKWGDPLTSLEIKREQTGKAKGKGKVEELVVRVPEKPENYLPLGHELLYGKWVLFRDMPNDRCCKAKVKRLQYHLGALRYWVGDHGQPYRPQSKPPKAFINEGSFEVVTWNAVLAFQRDAKAGSAKKVGPAVTGLMLAGYDPTPAAQSNKNQRELAPKFVVDDDAAPADATFADLPYQGVVDVKTGDAIKAWIDKGLRKPRAVLISAGDDSTWMSSRVQASFLAWSAKLEEYGFKQGVEVSNCLRDPRIGIKTGHGQISTSIHKSGFALDLTMAWGKPSPRYALQYVRDEHVNRRWIVYATVPEASIPKDKVDPVYDPADTKKETIIGYKGKVDAYIEYVGSVAQFVYDGHSSQGGAPGPAVSAPGTFYLNVTKIAHENGYARIGPHKSGWAVDQPQGSFTLTDAGALRAVVERLRLHVKQVHDEHHVPIEESFKLDGKQTAFTDIEGSLGLLESWAKVAGGAGAAPEVHVDPTSKAGEALLAALRAAAKKWKGAKFLLTQDPPPKPKGDAPAGQKPIDTAAPPKDPPPPQTTEIEIDGKTEFPKAGFTLVPKTSPQLKHGDVFEMPDIVGDPAHLEWWHFQWVAGYQGLLWEGILLDIGWTREGLLGTDGGNAPGIYGHFGVGYTSGDLSHSESTGINN